jgi:NTP pyrophosphatase (non-canonical NTP hydrolase)
MRDLNIIEKDVLVWAEARNLIEGSNPQAQFVKLAEEFGELASGICKNNQALTEDSIGDMMVVLTIICAQLDIDLQTCFGMAYDEIKDRKGRMIDGVFVKEADLNE